MEAAKQQLEKYFREIGEACPFSLATRLGVEVSYNNFGQRVLGFYTSVTRYEQGIYLNSEMDPESQEKACLLLISRHITHKGFDFVVTVDDLKKPKQKKQAVGGVMKSIKLFRR